MSDAAKILLVGAIGVGAFFAARHFMAKPAAAAAPLPATNSPGAQALYRQNDNALWKQIGGILGGLVSPASIAASQASAIGVSGAGASGGYIGDDAIYVPDAAAVNPVVDAAFSYGQQFGNWLGF